MIKYTFHSKYLSNNEMEHIIKYEIIGDKDIYGNTSKRIDAKDFVIKGNTVEYSNKSIWQHNKKLLMIDLQKKIDDISVMKEYHM